MPETKFSAKEQLRYQRHFSLQQFGLKGQKLLKNAKVLCVGAGGLGNPLALYLAAAGVGNIGIIDDDRVELSNLQRQVLFGVKDINKFKVAILQKKLTELNPHVKITIHKTKLIKANALAIIKQYDVIADGTDNFATRYLINDACYHLNKPNVFSSVFQFEGQCTVFHPKITPCYRCLYPSPPPLDLIPNCAEGGVLGVLPGIMGTIQATEVIKLITKIGEPLQNRLLVFNALKMQFRELPLIKNPQCPICAKRQSFANLPTYANNFGITHCAIKNNSSVKDSITTKELKNLLAKKTKLKLLDVRESFEYKDYNIGAKSLPLNQLSQNLDQLNKNDFIVVMCKSGGRSKVAQKILQKAGFTKVVNLVGGIDAWK